MTKTWDQMTTEEKVEDLRRDMLHVMATVNAWTQSQSQLGADHNRVSTLLSEVAAAVKELERKVGK